MNYELFVLESLIEDCLEGKQEEITETFIPEEKLRISAAIRRNVLTGDQALITPFIHQHQHGLIWMLKKMEKAKKGNINSKTQQRIYQDILDVIITLFDELEEFYPEYLDQTTAVPALMLKERNAGLQLKWNTMQTIFMQANVQTRLIDILSEFMPSSAHSSPPVCYGQLNYLDSLTQTLSDQFAQSPPRDTFELIIFLIRLNFNPTTFYDFCNEFLIQSLDSSTLPSRLELLYYFKKRLTQATLITTTYYQKDLPSINESLTQMVDAEIEYLKSINTMSENLAPETKHFQVNLTVRQLAIFINLQISCGIIIADKPKIIHEYVSEHYSTPDADKISEKSFKNAYYGNSAADLDKVLEKITQMLIIGQKKY